VSEDGAAAPAVAGPGALLKAERERRGLSLPDVAESLHVDPKLAAALEANDFAAFGAPVYARGFLRQYALLMGLDPEQVLSQRAGLPPPPPLVPTARATPEPTDWRALRRAALALVLALIAGVVVGWILTRPGPHRALAPPPAPARASIAPAVTAAPAAPAAPAAEPAPVQEASAEPEPAEPVARVVSSKPARPAPAVAPGALSLIFDADCWVTVTDADGQRVFYDLGHAGQTRSVPGPAPWRVVVGDVNAVRLSVAGRSVSLRSAHRRGATAQLTVTADGGSG
jgi:cytoskeleton protein RodZ